MLKPVTIHRVVNHDEGISCANCKACCCKLEVMLMGEDDIPKHHTIQDAWGGWIMRRLVNGDGWCAALDRANMRCTIYPRRPEICRDFQMGDSDCLEQRRQLLEPSPVQVATPRHV